MREFRSLTIKQLVFFLDKNKEYENLARKNKELNEKIKK